MGRRVGTGPVSSPGGGRESRWVGSTGVDGGGQDWSEELWAGWVWEGCLWSHPKDLGTSYLVSRCPPDYSGGRGGRCAGVEGTQFLKRRVSLPGSFDDVSKSFPSDTRRHDLVPSRLSGVLPRPRHPLRH